MAVENLQEHFIDEITLSLVGDERIAGRLTQLQLIGKPLRDGFRANVFSQQVLRLTSIILHSQDTQENALEVHRISVPVKVEHGVALIAVSLNELLHLSDTAECFVHFQEDLCSERQLERVILRLQQVQSFVVRILLLMCELTVAIAEEN